MGMDIDYIAADQQLTKLKTLLDSLPHGERSDISDDIIDFVKSMYIKYPSGDII